MRGLNFEGAGPNLAEQKRLTFEVADTAVCSAKLVLEAQAYQLALLFAASAMGRGHYSDVRFALSVDRPQRPDIEFTQSIY